MNNCPYCNNSIKDKWLGNYSKCTNCGILILNQDHEKESINALYQTSWAKPLKNVDETGGTTFILSDKYLFRLKESLGIDDFTGLRILDFGAGRGEFSIALLQDGAEVFSVEPYGYDYLKEKHSNTYLDLGEIESVIFDGIVGLNVIEHLISPWNYLYEFMDLLLPGGWLFLTTPNSKGLNAIITGSKWREAKRRGHLYLFNSFSLKRMLSDCGFQNIQRLRWYLPYDDKFILNIKDWILQKLRLDGELKFLAFKPMI